LYQDSFFVSISEVDIVNDPQIIENAKRELSERLAGQVYKSLIPDSVKPPLTFNRAIMEKYRPLYASLPGKDS
jgi:hypothetical protein